MIEAVEALSMNTASKKARDIYTKPHPFRTSNVTTVLVATNACIVNIKFAKNKNMTYVTT